MMAEKKLKKKLGPLIPVIDSNNSRASVFSGWLWLIAGCLLFSGLFLRVTQIDALPPWHDEALTILHARGFTKGEFEQQIADHVVKMPYVLNHYQLQDSGRSEAEILKAVKWDDPEHLPFFTLMLHRWQQHFGLAVSTARKLPLYADLAQIAAMVWWGTEVCGAISGGVLGAGLLAASPLMLFFSSEIREYSLYALPTVLASAAMMRAWRVNSFPSWLLYTLLIGAGLNCSVLFGATVIAHAFYAFFNSLKTLRIAREGFSLPSRLAAFALSAFLGIVLFIPSFTVGFLANLKEVPLKMSYISIPPYPGELLNAILFNPGVIFYWLRNSNPALQNTVLGFLFPLILFWLSYVFKTKRSVFYFLISYFVPLIMLFWLPDLVLGGQRSLYFKYYLSVPLTVLVFATATFQSFLTSYLPGYRLLGLVSLLFIAGCELSSDYASTQLQEREIIAGQSLVEINKALKDVKNPLILSSETKESTNSIQILAMSHIIAPDAQLLWLSQPVVPADIQETNKFYLFSPNAALRDSINKKKYGLKPLNGMKYFWVATKNKEQKPLPPATKLSTPYPINKE